MESAGMMRPLGLRETNPKGLGFRVQGKTQQDNFRNKPGTPSPEPALSQLQAL